MAVNIKLFSLQTNTARCGQRDVFQGRKEVAADQTLAKSVAGLYWFKWKLDSNFEHFWIGSSVSSSAHIPVISFVTQETLSRRHDRWCNPADFKGYSSIAAGILFPCSILGVVFSVFFNSKYCCRNICNSGHCTLICHSVEPADRATLCSWKLLSVLTESFVQLRE